MKATNAMGPQHRRIRLAQLGVVVASLFGAAACTSLLGVTDITGADDGGSGSSGGGSSSGASGSSGSSSGTGGTSGAGSSGASGGSGGSTGSSGAGSSASDAGTTAAEAAEWVGTWALSGTWVVTCGDGGAGESIPAPTITWTFGASGLSGSTSNGCQFQATAFGTGEGAILTASAANCTLSSRGRVDQISFGKWVWVPESDALDGGIPTVADTYFGTKATDTVTLMPDGPSSTCQITIPSGATRE